MSTKMKFISITSRKSKTPSNVNLGKYFHKSNSNVSLYPSEEVTVSSSSRSNLSESSSSSQSRELTLLQLKEFCNLFHITISEIQIYRYACCHDFDYESARKAIQVSYDSPYLHLRMNGALVEQFHKRVMIPLRGLRSRENSQVIYLHAARYLHSQENSQLFIDNLYYLLNDMSRTKQDIQDGVCVIANMRHYGMKNYDMDTILQATKAVQGKLVPTQFTQLIYIDAPKVFMNGWKLLRPMLAPWMAKKVHFIKSDKLGEFLQDGYQDMLPQELGGWLSSAEMAEDYVDQKLYEEALL